MPRLGVLGTLVWDTIHGPGGEAAVNDWGGIAYTLAAWAAVAPPGWTSPRWLSPSQSQPQHCRIFFRASGVIVPALERC